MFFSISLYVALAVFGVGLAFKISTWFRYGIGLEAKTIPAPERVLRAVKGVFLSVFSVRILTLIRVFVFDVIFQVKTLRQDFLRWLMHICIYVGFMLLLFMHALERFITAPLFPDYASTLNPFLFLRDLFGLVVILGIAIAFYRRFVLKVPRLRTNAMDRYAVIILAIIMVSGFLLEGTKIGSHNEYKNMVEEYSSEDDEAVLRALEAYWVENFAVVSPSVKGPFHDETLSVGEKAHEMDCAGCHSPPQWAFGGYVTGRLITPVGPELDRAGVHTFLWYVHFLACWLGLAFLPFTKMFHVFTGPFSLLANAVMDREKSDPANIATRQVMELDACMHCCTCSLNCSVGMAFESIPNLNIFPSEKIPSVKALAAGKPLGEQELRQIQEGIYLCTNCKRCTVACPVGINLQDLWFNVRESLLQRGYPEFLVLSPFSFYRGLMSENGVGEKYGEPLDRAREAIINACHLMMASDEILPLTPSDRGFKGGLTHSAQGPTFSACYGCETCTTVCPVVANYENPQEALRLLPHQIMHSCALGLKDLALGSNMLWDCLTCYQCQEKCPQGVCVTDVLYELKNEAIRHVRRTVES